MAILTAVLFVTAFDVVHLVDGTRMVGEILPTPLPNSSGIHLLTPAGPVDVARQDVGSVRRRADLLSIYRRTRTQVKRQTHGALSLAEWCLNNGLYPEFFDTLDGLLQNKLEAEQSPPLMQSLLDRAVAEAIISGVTPVDVLSQDKIKTLVRLAAGPQPARALVAEQRLLAQPAVAADAIKGFKSCLKHSREPIRHKAAQLLLRLQPEGALDPLVAASLLDKSPRVRDTAREAALHYQHPNLAMPYVEALGQGKAALRQAAYPALSALGDPRAIPVLVRLLRPRQLGTGGPPRNHIFVGEQRSFVQDYEVEIAQGAVIAKPVVGILQSGSLLDVKVVGSGGTTVMERQVVVDLLSQLSDRDFGNDYVAWKDWWNAQGQKLLNRHFATLLHDPESSDDQ